MNTAIVWVLSITVLGVTPEHKSFAKYKTKQECEQALMQAKEQYRLDKKSIVGSCAMVFK